MFFNKPQFIHTVISKGKQNDKKRQYHESGYVVYNNDRITNGNSIGNAKKTRDKHHAS